MAAKNNYGYGLFGGPMTGLGILGLVVTLVVVDPLRSRTWAAGLLLGILLLGVGLLLMAGGSEPAVWV